MSLDALAREAARTGEYLARLQPKDWARTTRCPPMTVLDLAAHTRRGWARIGDMLDATPIEDEPEKDGATYFRSDRAMTSPAVLARAQAAILARAQADAAAHGTGAALLASWDALDHMIARAREASDGVYPSIFGTIRLSEYLRTRIVEMTVHHMDLRDAFGDAPAPDPGALEVTCDVLRQILGTDLRPHLDDVRFALIGTGRAPLDPAERATLGPLADLFPLLA